MGTPWYKSRSVEWHASRPAEGAKAFFFLGGAPNTPITVYADSAESEPHPNPVEADGNGRWPFVSIPFIASYGVRVTTEDAVQLWSDDGIANLDPVEVEVTVPVEERVQTGQHIWEPIQGIRAGYVRANGLTIGNASSTATERANDDTEDLFIYLWNALADAQAPVSGGRGGSAAADFAANKRITLTNLKGAIPIGLDDMGAVAGSFFTGVTFGSGNATTPGSSAGVNTFSLTAGQLAAHNHSGSTANAGGDHNHTGLTGNQNANHTHLVSGNTGTQSAQHTHSGTTGTRTHSHSGTTGGPTANHLHSFESRNALSLAEAGVTLGDVWTGLQTRNTNADDSPAHVHNFTTNVDGSHDHDFISGVESATHTHAISFSSGTDSINHQHGISASGTHTHTLSITTAGNADAIVNLPKVLLGTWYIKL
jgi:hypothetical protein